MGHIAITFRQLVFYANVHGATTGALLFCFYYLWKRICSGYVSFPFLVLFLDRFGHHFSVPLLCFGSLGVPIGHFGALFWHPLGANRLSFSTFESQSVTLTSLSAPFRHHLTTLCVILNRSRFNLYMEDWHHHLQFYAIWIGPHRMCLSLNEISINSE